MSILQPAVACAVMLVFSATVPALAGGGLGLDQAQAEQPAQGTESYQALLHEYQSAMKDYAQEARVEREKASKEGRTFDFLTRKPRPNVSFSPRFLAIAEKTPLAPEAVAALRSTIETSAVFKQIGPTTFRRATPLPTRDGAIKILREHYVTKPEIKNFLKMVASDDDAQATALVDDVIARNPDRLIRAFALKAKRARLDSLASFTEDIADPSRRAAIEKTEGAAFIKEQTARAATAKIELAQVNKILRESYGDLTADLEIGSPAPELVSQNLDGAVTRLSALRGKVVVFDIWATWCGPCKAMIPHEREMVERLKDRPFALVSISVDEKKQTLTDFLTKEKMPWVHWWNGAEGGIIDSWDVRHYPTIYVLDAQGVIRYKEIRGEELEKAVNALLAETVTKAAQLSK